LAHEPVGRVAVIGVVVVIAGLVLLNWKANAAAKPAEGLREVAARE
jgi:hypothetical protein